MTTITYIEPSGAQKTIEATDGNSVMETAMANNVQGIKAECGGSLACATCHVYVDEADIDRVGVPGDMEQEMLDFAAAELRPGSRLSCQIKISADLEGLVLTIPDTQE